MRDATIRAWNALQSTDNSVRQGSYAVPSARYRQVAFLYSQIDLRNVDPLLRNHLRNSIDCAKRSARVMEELEAEYRRISGYTETAAGIGALLGAAGSDGYDPEGDASAGAVFMGFLGAAVGEGEWQAVLDAHRSEIEQMDRDNRRIAELDGEIADKLSHKYGVPFSDVF